MIQVPYVLHVLGSDRERILKTPTKASSEKIPVGTYASLIGQGLHFTGYSILPFLFNLFSLRILPQRGHMLRSVDTLQKYNDYESTICIDFLNNSYIVFARHRIPT